MEAKKQKIEFIGINYKKEQKRRWNVAARSEGKRLVDWINDTLDEEAELTNSAITKANKLWKNGSVNRPKSELLKLERH